MTFTDWRQLPSTTDMIQAGGIVWRGIIAWDKGLAARAPHTGYARHQCEYIVWGTKGQCFKRPGEGPFPGCNHVSVRQSDKHHMTGKPTELMRRLVRMTPPEVVILDPFAGSGTTCVAAILEGRHFIGIEMTSDYADIAKSRIAQAQKEVRET